MTKTNLLSRLYRHGVQLMAVGIITGICVGIIVTFFNIAAELLAKYAKDLYSLIRENPAFIPLLFIALAAIAFLISTLSKYVPMVRGSGIPQTEGAARGLLELKWYKSLPSMVAACLVCIVSGLTAGAEGPSMFIGATCGDGTSKMLKCTDMERRYQLTGGACAGLAVAFNAPLTGIVFAFEEAHRRFTPAIFICAFSSVLSATITRNVLYQAMNMPITSSFSTYSLVQIPLNAYGFVALAAIISGLLGFGFYCLCLLSRKVFAKITFAKGMGKMLIPFLMAGVFGLITASAMGGGHSFIQSLGTNGGVDAQDVTTVFSSPIVVSLIIILLLRAIATVLNLGAGVPCGIFIPMLSIGACIGALVSKLCGVMGMDSIYADCIVMICMATFFASIVKAPITAIIMVVELTWQFTLLIPVILGVSFGYMVSEIFGAKPIYEVILDGILEDEHIHLTRHTYSTVIEGGSIAMNKPIRDILWPGNLLIRSIKRNGENVIAASDTVLREGDEITVQTECVDFNLFKTWVDEIVKPRQNLILSSLRRKKTPTDNSR